MLPRELPGSHRERIHLPEIALESIPPGPIMLTSTDPSEEYNRINRKNLHSVEAVPSEWLEGVLITAVMMSICKRVERAMITKLPEV